MTTDAKELSETRKTAEEIGDEIASRHFPRAIDGPQRQQLTQDIVNVVSHERVATETETTMHKAWRKRAEEAEAALRALLPPSGNPSTADGASQIALERQRQQSVEGWGPTHDDQHKQHELALAAVCYAMPPKQREFVYTTSGHVPKKWPWEYEAWKPSQGRIKELVKAGALIAAEIDRLMRLAPAQAGKEKREHE